MMYTVQFEKNLNIVILAVLVDKCFRMYFHKMAHAPIIIQRRLRQIFSHSLATYASLHKSLRSLNFVVYCYKTPSHKPVCVNALYVTCCTQVTLK